MIKVNTVVVPKDKLQATIQDILQCDEEIISIIPQSSKIYATTGVTTTEVETYLVISSIFDSSVSQLP